MPMNTSKRRASINVHSIRYICIIERARECDAGWRPPPSVAPDHGRDVIRCDMLRWWSPLTQVLFALEWSSQFVTDVCNNSYNGSTVATNSICKYVCVCLSICIRPIIVGVWERELRHVCIPTHTIYIYIVLLFNCSSLSYKGFPISASRYGIILACA